MINIRASLCAVAAVCATVLVLVPDVARADQFQPIPSPPTVTDLEVPPIIQPKYPNSDPTESGSSGVYTVSSTVTTNATLAALDTVTMCWYKGAAASVQASAVPSSEWKCNSGGGADTGFEMTWTEATAALAPVGTTGFAVTGSNHYSNVGSQVETSANTAVYDSGAQSMTIRFSFTVSNAMLAGTDWNVRVTAVYDADLCGVGPCPGLTLAKRTGAAQTANAAEVKYWGQVTTALDQLGFGVVPENTTSDSLTAENYAFVANADSDYTVSGTSFTYDPDGAGGVSPDVLTLTRSTPIDKQVQPECKASSHTEAEFVPFDGSGRALGVTLAATGESPKSSETIDCRLTYGKGATYALKAYAGTVTLSIAQK